MVTVSEFLAKIPRCKDCNRDWPDELKARVVAESWALLASIIETCKPNKMEAHTYVMGVPTAIAHGQQKYIEELLPLDFGK